MPTASRMLLSQLLVRDPKLRFGARRQDVAIMKVRPPLYLSAFAVRLERFHRSYVPDTGTPFFWPVRLGSAPREGAAFAAPPVRGDGRSGS